MTAFCNTVSVRGRGWETRSAGGGGAPPARTARGEAIPAELARVLVSRGVGDLASYFDPTLRASMPDPSGLAGMDEAAGRFCAAVEGREKIALFGDYDVDGATSTALVSRYLRLVGVPDSVFYIPDRMKEGYGVNADAVRALRARGASLLVLLDNGTTAFKPIECAVECGMDVLVLDHHEPAEDGALPRAVVVNPKRLDGDGGLSYLCTAGLAMMFLVAVNRRLRQRGFFARAGVAEPDLAALMGIVALGTVADVVPLVGLNRAFVKLGLRAMDRIEGIRALMERARRGQKGGERPLEYTARTCGFALGPCINAGGRISDTMQGARLLCTDDPEEAREIADRLFELNQERRKIQDSIMAGCKAALESCLARARAAGHADDPVIVVHDESWHPGVVGIVAARIRDEFDKTAVVIGQQGKGSGRAVPGFNIGRAFIKAAEEGLILKGGGHAVAGGLTVDAGQVDALRAFLNECARGAPRPPTPVDLVLPVGALRPEVVESFALMEPVGKDNEPPLVAFTGGILDEVRVLPNKAGGAEHLKCTLRGPLGKLDLMLFGAAGTHLGEALRAAEGRFVDVLGRPEVNSYRGASSIQVKGRNLEDVMVGAQATAEAMA